MILVKEKYIILNQLKKTMLINLHNLIIIYIKLGAIHKI
jgi:hypothetical protein